MEEVTKAELARKINKSGAIITRLINQGVLDKCFTPNGKKLFLDKSLIAIVKAKGSDYINSSIIVDFATKEAIKEDESIFTSEAKDELNEYLSQEPSPSKQIDMIDKFWSGRIRRQKFMVEESQLIPVADAKAVIEAVFTPINAKLDELPIMLKSHFNEVSLEAMRWLADEINQIKTDSQSAEFD